MIVNFSWKVTGLFFSALAAVLVGGGTYAAIPAGHVHGCHLRRDLIESCVSSSGQPCVFSEKVGREHSPYICIKKIPLAQSEEVGGIIYTPYSALGGTQGTRCGVFSGSVMLVASTLCENHEARDPAKNKEACESTGTYCQWYE